MHTIHLQPGDLENLRFAYSPLLETVMSYLALRHACGDEPHSAWQDEARRALYGVELPYLDALIGGKHYIADFITPTPAAPQTDIQTELVQVYATPDDIIRDNVLTAIERGGDNAIRQHYLAHPREALDCLMDELHLYWQYTIAHHWDRVQTVLENDVLYHARQMALHGIDSMFDDLSALIRYENRKLLVTKPSALHRDHVSYLSGEGLQLVPVVFYRNHSWHQFMPHWKPMLTYGARGTGLWYQAEMPEPNEALEIALGAGRARVLMALQSPAHTSELAVRLNLTSGAVSQHLQRLHQAGLVMSHRSSHRVYYRLSPRGEKLVGLFATSSAVNP